MKYLNGQVYPKPIAKTMLVIAIVLFCVAALIALLVFSLSDWELDSKTIYPGIIMPGFCLVPGLVLLFIWISKKSANTKEYRRMQSVDYAAWKAERLNDPQNPLFSVNCNRCGGLIEYDRRGIDGTRAWFPNGYVVCPNCRAIMRHRANTQPQNAGQTASSGT